MNNIIANIAPIRIVNIPDLGAFLPFTVSNEKTANDNKKMLENDDLYDDLYDDIHDKASYYKLTYSSAHPNKFKRCKVEHQTEKEENDIIIDLSSDIYDPSKYFYPYMPYTSFDDYNNNNNGIEIRNIWEDISLVSLESYVTNDDDSQLLKAIEKSYITNS